VRAVKHVQHAAAVRLQPVVRKALPQHVAARTHTHARTREQGKKEASAGQAARACKQQRLPHRCKPHALWQCLPPRQTLPSARAWAPCRCRQHPHHAAVCSERQGPLAAWATSCARPP
jgi:hypothetical protein